MIDAYPIMDSYLVQTGGWCPILYFKEGRSDPIGGVMVPHYMFFLVWVENEWESTLAPERISMN